MARGRHLACALALTVLLLTGCVVQPDAENPPASVPTPTATTTHGSADESFLLRYDETELVLADITDGTGDTTTPGADDDAAPIGSPDELFVFVPQGGWPLTVTQYTGERYSCDSLELNPQVEELGRGWWAIRPVGPAQEYTIDLVAGSGPGSPLGTRQGALGAFVQWTTPGGPELERFAEISFFADDGTEVTAGDLWLSLGHLAETPTEASASVTVTAANGRSATFEPPRDADCIGVGWISFALPADQVQSAAELGEGPFTYDVEITLDGTVYRATGQYDTGPIGVALDFTPALP